MGELPSDSALLDLGAAQVMPAGRCSNVALESPPPPRKRHKRRGALGLLRAHNFGGASPPRRDREVSTQKCFSKHWSAPPSVCVNGGRPTGPTASKSPKQLPLGPLRPSRSPDLRLGGVALPHRVGPVGSTRKLKEPMDWTGFRGLPLYSNRPRAELTARQSEGNAPARAS